MDPVCTTTLATAAEPGWFERLWETRFMAHGYCYLWRPEILWPQVIADALIALSYYSIPLILLFFVRRRRDIPFNKLVVVFALFILACGTTHLIEIISVWEPMYRTQAIAKVVTAGISLTAVAMLIPAVPPLLALPSLSTSNRRLQRVAEELRRSNQDLAQFAYVASHDLQEPLRMVTLNLDLLERRLGPLPDAAMQRNLDFAREGADRMRGLLDGLLAYGEVDALEAPAPAASVEPALDEVLAQLAPTLQAAGATVERRPLPPLPLPRTHAALVFRHLLANALRFRAEGRAPRITVSAVEEPRRLGIKVTDNGIGIAPEHRLRVFRMFQRLHDRERYPGIGVGLATIKKIAERNGGEVRIDDGDQGGIAVVLTFPLPVEESAIA